MSQNKAVVYFPKITHIDLDVFVSVVLNRLQRRQEVRAEAQQNKQHIKKISMIQPFCLQVPPDVFPFSFCSSLESVIISWPKYIYFLHNAVLKLAMMSQLVVQLSCHRNHNQ